MNNTEEIKSLRKLSYLLGVPRDILIDISGRKKEFYHPFDKPKKNNPSKKRHIDNPSAKLKLLQSKINKLILEPAIKQLPGYMTGCIKGKSIRDNVELHVGKEAILTIDLKDCFPSISSKKVYDLFREKFQCSPPVAKILTKLTTYGNHIPQGSPTSASLCNLILFPMLDSLNKLASENNLEFSQYVDDMTFSGLKSDINRVISLILDLIFTSGFKVNKDKLFIKSQNQSMKITGVVVNKKMSVGSKKIHRIQRDIIKDPKDISITGKISYVGMFSRRKAIKLKKKLDQHLL